MKSSLLIIVLLFLVVFISGCSDDEIYMCNTCNTPNLTDVNVYNCSTRNTGVTGYDYTTNDYYYCNTTTWVKLNNQSGGSGTTIFNYTYYINTTNNITNNITYYINTTNNITIGGGSGLSIFDLVSNAYYFSRWDMESVTAGYTERWIPTAITTGTTAIVAGTAKHPGRITISNSNSKDSGYSYSIGNADAFLLDDDYFTILSFNATFSSVYWNSSEANINGTNIRFGFQDVYTIVQPTDGCYINITQQNISRLTLTGMCINNSIVNKTTTNYSFIQNMSEYTVMIYVHNKSSLVRFYLYNEDDTLLWNDIVTSRIPIASGRSTGHGLVVFRNNNSTARIQGVFDYMSIGINRTIVR